MIQIGTVLDMFVFRIDQESIMVKARKHTAVVVDVEGGILTICTDKHRERIVPPSLFIPTHEMFKARGWCNEEETLSLIMAYPGNMTWKGAFPLLQKSARKAIRDRVKKVKDEAYMSLKIIDNGKFV
jgi:hypothetical protein